MERQGRSARTEILTFEYYPLEFEFKAVGQIRFPKYAGNCLRGALGEALRRSEKSVDYERIFRPVTINGPRGYRTPPKPFVLRCRHLDGAQIEAGQMFCLRINLFDRREGASTIEALRNALCKMFEKGIGPKGGRAELTSKSELGEQLSLSPTNLSLFETSITISFESFTDLKGYDSSSPLPFATLLQHAQARLNIILYFYGNSSLNTRSQGLPPNPKDISVTCQNLKLHVLERKSSRTGNVHNIGGFTGFVKYFGACSQSIPWLKAASAIGIGRHTTWGNGEISVIAE